jgi:colanic acid biosynthesis glycosyl transferase WcaI
MSAAETPRGATIRPGPTRASRATRSDGPADVLTPTSEGHRLHGRHVLVVGLDYSPAATPLASYTTGIAEHLATLADEVTVLTGLPERPTGGVPAAYRRGWRFCEAHWETPEAPWVVRLRHVAGAGPTRPIRQFWREVTFCAAVLLAGRKVDADLVVAVTPAPGGAAAAARLATRRGAPMVMLVQGTAATPPVAIPSHRSRSGIARRLAGRVTNRMTTKSARWLERYALHRSSEVTVAREEFAPAVLAAGVEPEHLHLLPNWIQPHPATASRPAARETLGWPADRFIVVHAGSTGHHQDLATVIEAARLVEAVDVVLAGVGPQRVALERQADGLDNVRFVDITSPDAQDLVLDAADVLLVTGLGSTAAAEPEQLRSYLAAGRPVLAAVPERSTVCYELRRAGGVGLRVDPSDPQALAEAMLTLRTSPQLQRLMGRTALRYARAQLSRTASLRRLELVVDAALPDRAADLTTDRTPSVLPTTRYRPSTAFPPGPRRQITVELPLLDHLEAGSAPEDTGRGC